MKNESALILNELAESVVAMDEEKAMRTSKKALDNQIDPYLAISEGLAKGMEIMGAGYEKGTCFVPELLLASDAMYAGVDVLKPHLVAQKTVPKSANYRAVIGVMEGDTHDIGKNLVKIMFEAAGFQMFDLGRDVSPQRFFEAAVKEKVDLICLSSLMTTSVAAMQDVITMLINEGVRHKFKVMVGGACVSPAFAQRIGADGFASNASAAVKAAKLLLETSKVG
jgi:corrinoid protein of di/trimethylamine methyltransferase